MSVDKRKAFRLIIRLYRQFDLDLIYIFNCLQTSDNDTQAFVKKILRKYVVNDISKTEADERFCEKICHPYPLPRLTLRRKVQYHVLLNEGEDNDIIEWVNSITIGYRNTCVKNIIRSYFQEPCLVPCLKSTSLTLVGKDAACPSGVEETENVQ